MPCASCFSDIQRMTRSPGLLLSRSSMMLCAVAWRLLKMHTYLDQHWSSAHAKAPQSLTLMKWLRVYQHSVENVEVSIRCKS